MLDAPLPRHLYLQVRTTTNRKPYWRTFVVGPRGEYRSSRYYPGAGQLAKERREDKRQIITLLVLALFIFGGCVAIALGAVKIAHAASNAIEIPASINLGGWHER